MLTFVLAHGDLGLSCGLTGKESTCTAGDLGWIPGLGRFTGKGKGYPLHYSGLENSMDCTVYGVAKSWTRQNDCHFLTSSTARPPGKSEISLPNVLGCL